MSELPPKPLPTMDRDSLPFWEGVRAGELRIQRCRGCGAYRWPARAICNCCRSFDAEWVKASGKGVVKSWVVTHQVFARAFQDDVPYSVILVQLEEQVDLQMIGRFSDPAIEPRAEMAVEAVFALAGGDDALVLWKPITEGS
jgi:uncharacterized OB-fold protein